MDDHQLPARASASHLPPDGPGLVRDPAALAVNGSHNGSGDGQATAAEIREIVEDSPRQAAERVATAMLSASRPTTAEHSDDVELLCAELCERLGSPPHDRESVSLAARLHDVGKVAVPTEILEKPGPLDDNEWRVVKQHTIVGERILSASPALAPAAELVRHSHEHFDGSGYPDGLAGEQIPLGSRIILCADAFHAIRSDRPYRRGRDAAAALAELRANQGRQFDPAVVEALAASMADARRSGMSRRIPRRVLVLLLTFGIGGGSVFAAERGWIPSPLPGIGPDGSSESSSPAAPSLDPAARKARQGDGPDRRGASGGEADGGKGGGGESGHSSRRSSGGSDGQAGSEVGSGGGKAVVSGSGSAAGAQSGTPPGTDPPGDGRALGRPDAPRASDPPGPADNANQNAHESSPDPPASPPAVETPPGQDNAPGPPSGRSAGRSSGGRANDSP